MSRASPTRVGNDHDRPAPLPGRRGRSGGAELISWTGPETDRAAGITQIRQLAKVQSGVLSVHDPAEFRLGARTGDVLRYARAGFRFSDTTQVSNPLPGNHGHPATLPIPFFVGGGSPLVSPGRTSSSAARTIDVAPTIGSLFGLAAPPGGYDGTARTEAFTTRPAKRPG